MEELVMNMPKNIPNGATHFRKKIHGKGWLFMINVNGNDIHDSHHFIWLGFQCGGWSKMPFKHPNLHTFTEIK